MVWEADICIMYPSISQLATSTGMRKLTITPNPSLSRQLQVILALSPCHSSPLPLPHSPMPRALDENLPPRLVELP